VGLFQCITEGNFLRYSKEPNKKTRTSYIATDSKGYFIFDDLLESEYFLVVLKDGYAAVGPFFYKKPGYFEENNGRSLASQIERFYLEEGQIKHLKIKMEKEAILKVRVLRKTFSGVEPIDAFKVKILHPGFAEKFEELIDLDQPIITDTAILEKLNKYYKKKYTPTEDGFQTLYFKKGLVSLTIEPNGYPPKTFENIQLEKGKTELFEYIVDFTKPPVVYGTIINKETGKPFHVVYIDLEKQDEPNRYFSMEYYSHDGKYWLGGMEPGKYELSFSSYAGNKDFEYEVFLNITSTSMIEINKNF